MAPDPVAIAEAAAASAQAELEAYLRGAFVDQFTRAVTLNALAAIAEASSGFADPDRRDEARIGRPATNLNGAA